MQRNSITQIWILEVGRFEDFHLHFVHLFQVHILFIVLSLVDFECKFGTNWIINVSQLPPVHQVPSSNASFSFMFRTLCEFFLLHYCFVLVPL
jgi:hypothetical protein